MKNQNKTTIKQILKIITILPVLIEGIKVIIKSIKEVKN